MNSTENSTTGCTSGKSYLDVLAHAAGVHVTTNESIESNSRDNSHTGINYVRNNDNPWVSASFTNHNCFYIGIPVLNIWECI